MTNFRPRPTFVRRRSAIGRRAGAARLTFTPNCPDYRYLACAPKMSAYRRSHLPLSSTIAFASTKRSGNRLSGVSTFAVGRHEVARQEHALALRADLELVQEHRRVRVRRARGDADAVGARDRRRDHEPVDRRALVLQLLGLVVVDGERERHLARGDELGRAACGPCAPRRRSSPRCRGRAVSALLLAQLSC